ncbi:MAG: hypothetical protein AAFO51_10335 [Pseudomonadota bacterium]
MDDGLKAPAASFDHDAKMLLTASTRPRRRLAEYMDLSLIMARLDATPAHRRTAAERAPRRRWLGPVHRFFGIGSAR